jgi:hypothetical protein
MDELENEKRAGKFTVSPGKDIYGELTFSGGRTSLYLRDEANFTTHGIANDYIKGCLHDLTKVSLLRCITTSGTGSARQGDESYHFATVFPHFIVYGNDHLAPDDKTIVEVHFAIDDASTLFYDFDAFGSVINARPFIDTIARANALPRTIETGPNPAILYFTGKTQIFSTATVLGRISASHHPSHTLGGPGGVRLTNTILVKIAFDEPMLFEDSIRHTLTLLRFLELLLGRPQNIPKMRVRIKSDQERPVFLNVYWSMRPKREPSREEEKPHPADVLLDTIRKPEEFSRVLANWLKRQQAWRNARAQFASSFAQQNRYDADRLVACANMFDILPDSAVQPHVPLTIAQENARDASREMFLALPPSPERNSVLGALGRMGRSSLRHKIRHRAELIAAVAASRFPDLETVIDEAVTCRNYFVHGSDPSFDYGENFDAVNFFTDTLEFIFAASDLIEAGWDLKAWIEIPTSMSHPFARFRVGYAESLRKLKALLPPQASPTIAAG